MGNEQLKYDQKGLSMLALGLKCDGFPRNSYYYVQTCICVDLRSELLVFKPARSLNPEIRQVQTNN